MDNIMLYVAAIICTGLMGFALSLTFGLMIAEIAGMLLNLDSSVVEFSKDRL